MTEFAITCSNLTKHYRRKLKKFTAVDSLDLSVPSGAVFGLLGPNGAGKTTTIHMLLGIVKPSSGAHTILDSTIASAKVRQRVGYVPEKFSPPEFLRAQEFMEINGALAGMKGKGLSERIDSCLELAGLVERRGDRIKTFSKGMQQRLSIAQALLANPDLLILDEPTSALDPLGRRDVRAMIKHINATGTTVVLNSHLLAEVESVCDQVAILDHGKLVRQGTIDSLSNATLSATLRVGSFPDELRRSLLAIDPNLAFERNDSGGTTVVRMTVPDDNSLPQIALAVFNAGVDLHAMIPEKESLEDLFVRFVEGNEVSSGQATS